MSALCMALSCLHAAASDATALNQHKVSNFARARLPANVLTPFAAGLRAVQHPGPAGSRV